jgi:ABC-2 type transport system permease protein
VISKAVGALVIKEFKQIKRDVSSILVAFVMPLLILVIFGYGMSFDIKNIRIDVVQQDSGKIAKDLVDLYSFSDYFSANVVKSTQEARGNMESGKTMGTIIIPDGFSKNIRKGKPGPRIQIVSDGTDPNTAAYIEAYSIGLFSKCLMSLQKSNRAPLNIINRLWFNPTTESINFLMAGALTMILAIVGTFLTSLVVAKEWERGTMEAIISTPISSLEIVLSKIIPYFGLCVVSLTIALSYGVFVFNMPFEGSIFAMALVSCVFIMVSLLIGLLISTATKNQFVAAMGAVTVTFMPTFMLSGFVFEIQSMPKWIQLFSYIFPSRYYVSSTRTICLVGDIWEIILEDVCILGCMCVAIGFLLKKALKKKIA